MGQLLTGLEYENLVTALNLALAGPGFYNWSLQCPTGIL